MDVKLSLADVSKKLQEMGYNDDDIFYMTKEPFYSIIKWQLEEHSARCQTVSQEDYLEKTKNR